MNLPKNSEVVSASRKITIAKKKRLKKYTAVYVMAGIVLAFYVLFCYVPMYGVIVAFKEYTVFQGIWGSPWADHGGFGQFVSFLTDSYFWVVVKNTLIISGLRILFCFTAPIFLALMLNELTFKRFKKSVQTLIYLPRFLSWVIVAGLTASMLSPTLGMFNQLRELLGFEPIDFLTEAKYFRTILILTDLWKGAGWGTIIYIAALAGVNPELYEAADLDGCGRFRKMWYISLACIKPTIVMQFILALSGILNGGFDQIFVLYTPSTYVVGDIIDTYVYRMAFKSGNFSYSTAVGLFKSVIGFALVLGSDKFFKLIGEQGII